MDYVEFFQKIKEGESANGCDCTLKIVEQIVAENQLPLEKVVEFCKRHGGYCDCEVLYNMDPEEHPYIKEE